jgi:hypothetical protein
MKCGTASKTIRTPPTGGGAPTWHVEPPLGACSPCGQKIHGSPVVTCTRRGGPPTIENSLGIAITAWELSHVRGGEKWRGGRGDGVGTPLSPRIGGAGRGMHSIGDLWGQVVTLGYTVIFSMHPTSSKKEPTLSAPPTSFAVLYESFYHNSLNQTCIQGRS